MGILYSVVLFANSRLVRAVQRVGERSSGHPARGSHGPVRAGKPSARTARTASPRTACVELRGLHRRAWRARRSVALGFLRPRGVNFSPRRTLGSGASAGRPYQHGHAPRSDLGWPAAAMQVPVPAAADFFGPFLHAHAAVGEPALSLDFRDFVFLGAGACVGGAGPSPTHLSFTHT